ncbi:MAG: hypothetical protein HYX68_03655 [Planctomycetes bacterium]|jgi:hypothetical protein|nr:hypothetical protein [Planctomycetota bacterium]
MANLTVAPYGWERTARAVEKVKDRLKRAVSALRDANVPYAVVGGNAVAEWVGRADEAAVRNTRDVDILLRRADFEPAKAALVAAGFIHCKIMEVDMFLDGEAGRAKDGVHVVFAGERLDPNNITPAPDVAESEPAVEFQVIALPALVRMKLNAFRLKDRVHLVDMIDVGLVDQTWPANLPPELGKRLQELLDNPNG